MSRIMSIALVASISLLTPVTLTHAGPKGPMLHTEQPQLQLAGYENGYFPEGAIQAWQGERFDIFQIKWFEPWNAQRVMIENWVDANPGDVDALQASIRSNPALATALRSHRVQIHNVAAVRQAFSGNLIFYLR